MAEIESEGKKFFFFLFYFIKLPFLLVGAMFNQKARHALLEPIPFLLRFYLGAWGTVTLIGVCMIMFFVVQVTLVNTGFIPIDTIEALMWHNEYLANFSWFSLVALVSHLFMHGSLTHLFANIVALFIFGRVVERTFQASGTIVAFLLTGVIATISYSSMQILFFKNSAPLLGASGAIYGLMACAMLLEPFYFTFALGIPLPIMIVGWAYVLMDFTGVLYPNPASNVAHLAHISGFAAATAVMFVFKHERGKMLQGLLINIIVIAAIIAGVKYFGLGLL